jgi:hypothetical protein
MVRSSYYLVTGDIQDLVPESKRRDWVGLVVIHMNKMLDSEGVVAWCKLIFYNGRACYAGSVALS